VKAVVAMVGVSGIVYQEVIRMPFEQLQPLINGATSNMKMSLDTSKTLEERTLYALQAQAVASIAIAQGLENQAVRAVMGK
jgi:hypothetical protein